MTHRSGDPNSHVSKATHDSKIGIVGTSDQTAEGNVKLLTMETGQKGDFDIRIAADGTWFHEGRPINRKRLVKLFSTILSRDEAGDYWLRTPVEAGRIEVEDAPFTIVDMDSLGSGREQQLLFTTNLDEEVRANAENPIRIGGDVGGDTLRPYVLVRPGLEGLVLRSVFYRMAELAVEDENGLLGVWSGGTFFPLSDTP